MQHFHLYRLLYPKLSGSLNDVEKRRLSMLYRCLLSGICITFVFLLLKLVHGYSILNSNNLLIAITYGACLYLFKKEFHNSSRNLFLALINILVFSANAATANAAGIYLFFFPIATGTFLLFTEKENKFSIAFSSIPLLLFFISMTSDVRNYHATALSENLNTIYIAISAALSITTTVYGIYYYLKLYQKSSKYIRDQHACLESLIENIGGPVWEIDNKNRLTKCNTAFQQFMKDTFHEHIDTKQNLENISNAEYQDAYDTLGWKGYYRRALQGEKVETTLQIDKSNSTKFYRLKLNPITVNEETTGAVMTLENITDRVNSEKLLSKKLYENQRLSTIANTIKHSILVTDGDFKIIWANPYFIEFTKYSLSELAHTSTFDLLKGHLTEEQSREQLFKKLKTGKSYSIETVLYKKNKEPFWCYISSSPVQDENGNISGYVFIGIDITERKRSEDQLQLLLNHAQKLNRELAERDTDLQSSIRKLNKQSWEIQISKQHLQKKKSELEKSNQELHTKAVKLEQTNADVILQNKELEIARKAICQKAQLLEQANKYKSEFLANMSHELRTPLNSVIILSRLLAENKDSNLTRKQIEFAHVVHKSGTDLLNLINDILDLSKIEAGKIEIEKAEFEINEICKDLTNSFDSSATNKGIMFRVQNKLVATQRIYTDEMRLSQILKNLLSNAIKFTSEGGTVDLVISETEDGYIRFEVMDSGIGIPGDKQQIIFESFKQVDGSISRRFGGTGLGLSISKELTHLLSGRISVSSKEGEGSTFSIEIPIGISSSSSVKKEQRKILIIEDDETFASILEKMAMKEGFEAEKCYRGDTGYIRIKETKPDAILLDMNIPGINGWNLIKRVKADKELSHIPIHVVSSSQLKDSDSALQFESWFEKPASTLQLTSLFKELKFKLGKNHNVLVIEDSPEQGMIVKHMLHKQGISCKIAETGKEGTQKLKQEGFDCIILDLNLPDSDGMQLLKQFKEEPEFSSIPVIVYSSRDLSEKEKLFLKDYASSYINKNNDQLELLLEETTLFLKSVQEQKSKRKSTTKLPEKADILAGKKVLVVDDDQRNIYALSSMLELYGMEIHTESDGLSAVNYLEKNPLTDVVLMDIMMPGIDGYEATKRIRNNQQLSKIPIIAVTAKAMKGDREISIASGLNDHITKPIESSTLLNIISNIFQ